MRILCSYCAGWGKISDGDAVALLYHAMASLTEPAEHGGNG